MKMKTTKIKESTTKTIKRSQIHLNPFNPKNHTDEEIKAQKADIRRVGYLGGVVWNEATGNLVDGHRRVLSLDEIHHYDGNNDYEIKVEAVDFDDKTEKEQMTFMAIKNSKADYNLIAKYLNDIDPAVVGISDEDVRQLQLLQDDFKLDLPDMDDADDLFLSVTPQMEKAAQQPLTELPRVERTSEEILQEHKNKPKMTKEEVKAAKAHCDDVKNGRFESIDTFVFVDFSSIEEKITFCELLGKEPENNMRISGHDIMNLVE